MSEFIDKAVIKQSTIERWNERASMCGFYDTGCEYGKADDLEWIDSLPTIDAVEVVRCKECKHVSVDRYVDGNVPCLSCNELDVNVDCDWFCADGERREG